MPETQATQISPRAVSYSYRYGLSSDKTASANTSFANALNDAMTQRSDFSVPAYSSPTTSASTGVDLSSMLTAMLPSMYPSMDQTSSSSGGDSQMMVMLLLMMLLKQQGNTGNTQTATPVTVDDIFAAGNTSEQEYVPQTSAGSGNVTAGNSIPSAPHAAVNPPIVNTPANRSAAAYRAVIDQFKVETRDRYQPKNGNTYCNIFMWDVTRAMNAEIPHYINAKTGQPMYYPDTKGATELNANATQDWLLKYGQQQGWREVSVQEAQAWANSGKPAVTSWKNSGGVGHVQVVCPSKDGGYNVQKGVTVAQAGRKNTSYTYASDIFGKNAMSKLKYFVHV
jgi:hypothetical protein